MPATEREPGPHNTSAGRERTGSTGESVGSSFSASIGGKLRRTANGDVDVLHALGGWRGVVESLLPATLFLVVFVVTKQLTYALIASLVTSGVFTVAVWCSVLSWFRRFRAWWVWLFVPGRPIPLGTLMLFMFPGSS